MEDKIREIIEKEIKPVLATEGGSIDLVGVEDGKVMVQLKGACAGCPMSQMTVKNFVETTLKNKIPEIKEVVST